MRQAILDATWALVTEHGLTAVTMSQIAEKVGIGRATLYKYFPDVEAILLAWHHRHVAGHLEHLSELAEQAGSHPATGRATGRLHLLLPCTASPAAAPSSSTASITPQ